MEKLYNPCRVSRNIKLSLSVLALAFSTLANATINETCSSTPGTPDCDLNEGTYLSSNSNTMCNLTTKFENIVPGTPQTSPDGNITINPVNSKIIDWTSKVKVCQVLVGGGSYFNPYIYSTENCACTGSGLVAIFDNENNCTYDVSHVTFLYTKEPCVKDKCYNSETAWAAGNQYLKKGNWATFVDYSAGGTKVVTLFAGKTINAGTAKLEPSGSSVKITITLQNGFGFYFPDGEKEDFKVQDYGSAPYGVQPIPGQFAYKQNVPLGSTSATMIVPANKFYGIHLDVAKEVACPVTAP